MSERRPSVTFIVAAILVTVTTLVLGAGGAVNYFLRLTEESARLERITNSQADEIAVALALPVWNIDRAQIDKILDSQEGAPSVEAVVVNAAGGRQARMRDANRRFVSTSAAIQTEGLLVEERPIVFGKERIGTVVLYTTPRSIEKQMRQTLLATLIMIVVTDLLLVLSTYAVLYRTMLRPLVKVERFAAAVSAGGEADVPSIEPAKTAELERLRSSIDTMVRTIKSEKDFTETAIDVVRDMFFVQDREGHFVRWNKATSDLFGAEALKKPEPYYILNHVAHPEDRLLVRRAIDEIFDGVGFAETEARYFLPEGTRNIHLTGRRMEIEGTPYIVGTAVDVTERRSADAERRKLREAIQQSAIEWRQTFDSVTTPIIITDGDGLIQRLNQSAAAMSGYDERELAGRNVSELIHQTHGRTWDININPLFPGSDDRSQIVVFWDITRIVALQESLRRQETMTAMGKLVGGVAHEVRNPLFGISATLDAYSEEMNTAELREMAATLRDQVGRLSRLMQELLEFGKPVAVARKRGALDSLINEVIASRSPAASEAQVTVQNDVDRDVPQIPMDRERLRQVLENVVDNALQHSPRGTMVTINGNMHPHNGSECVELRIEDQGRGFLPGEIPHVFEPFFTRRERGTGLGLSIVQKIVEEHEGVVRASNRAEGGARITIRLPV
ncbi:MAG TPA: ATP-binding protein [Thermoanaerobaculia bacterium]|nr:ATP-binding protein [Thermoanaerobaculia bacterium]